MSLLFATELPLPSPTGIAEGLTKQGLYYVVGVLCVVVAFLFYKLLSDRDKFQADLTALAKEAAATVAEDAKQTVLNTHVLAELRADVAELRRAILERQPRIPSRPKAGGESS